MTRLRFAILVSGLLAASAGCALTEKGKPLSPRYFSPELGTLADAPVLEPTAAGTKPLELRLGPVEAASHLEERMAYRVNDAELGYYDERRWSERPEEYVRRALEAELFERRHVRRILAGGGNTLAVEVLAFEELRTPTPRVRLALHFTVHDDRTALLEKTITIEQPLPAAGDRDRARDVASAMAVALREAVTQTADLVTSELKPRQAASMTADGGATTADTPR